MTRTANAPMPHELCCISAFLPKPELPTDLRQIDFKANRLSCPELVMLVYSMCYVSTPGLKHHTQRLQWQGAWLLQIFLLHSIGTLIAWEHQFSLTSKAFSVRDSFKQPECNIPLILGKEQEAFWTLWYLFMRYLHYSGSKAVACPALKQSKRQTTTPLFHKDMWEYPKINLQTWRGFVKVHGPGWFSLFIALPE